MKILLFGASGLIGTQLQRALSGHKFADMLGDYDLFAMTHRDCDVCSERQVTEVFNACKPDWVINATGYTAVDKAEEAGRPAELVNSVAVGLLATKCHEVGAKLVHISSDYVFSGNDLEPYDETDTPNPLNSYGRSKLGGETAVQTILQSFIILRTSWVFGVEGRDFVGSMLALANTEKEVSVVSDQLGGPTSSCAVAEAIIRILAVMRNAEPGDKRWGIYHFCGYPHVSWSIFAEKIFATACELKLISLRPKIEKLATVDYPSIAARPLNSRLACNKINEVFSISTDDWQVSLIQVLENLEYRVVS